MLDRLEEHLARREWVQLDREARRLSILEPLTVRQRGRVLQAWGRAKAGLNDPYAAVKLMERAMPLALKAKDWDCLGFLRADLGALYITIGDIEMGVDYLRGYLLDSQWYKEAEALYGKVRFNLAVGHKHRKRYDLAIGEYCEVIDWCTLRGHILEKAMAHQNLAWLLCVVGRQDEARINLEVADTYRERLSASFDAEQVCCWAYYHWSVGQVGCAINCVQEILLGRREGVDDYHRGQAALVGARVALRLNQEYPAKLLVSKATDFSAESGDPALASECAVVRTAIQEIWGASQEAAQ